MDPRKLSPVYGLTLMRLDAGDGMTAWPAVLLHSHSFSWAFDEDPHVFDNPDITTPALARAADLHQIHEPFAPLLPDADGWTFHLPGAHPARLSGPVGVVELGRTPHISPAWWSLAVEHGARCRLLIAACVRMPDDPEQGGLCVNILNEAARDGRVYGGTITVEFFRPAAVQEPA